MSTITREWTLTEPVAAASQPPPDLDARYLPFDGISAWVEADAYLELFDEAAAEFQRIAARVGAEQAQRAVRVAVRAAAFDTGAIEGLYRTDRGVTFSVAEQAAAWEAVVAQEAGRDAIRHFRAQLAGFELVLDAATGATPVTSAWLRALHETICNGQDTFRALTAVGWQEVALPKGEFKRWSNHVRTPEGSWHSYAPADQTAAEVQRLVDEIGSPEFASAHPVVQAAFAHHALVAVHPFADGNGRVARALGSVFLYRATRVPLHVWADQRGRYLAALQAADSGDRAAFVRFLRDTTVDTIRLVVLRLRPVSRRAAPAEPRRPVVSMRVTGEPADAMLARRVLTMVAELARQRVAGGSVEMLDGDAGILADHKPEIPLGYTRQPVASRGGAVRIAVGDPERSQVVIIVRAMRPDTAYGLALVAGGVPALPLRREQLDPAMADVVTAQLAAWVDDLADRLATGEG